jgi:hypothetical protein
MDSGRLPARRWITTGGMSAVSLPSRTRNAADMASRSRAVCAGVFRVKFTAGQCQAIARSKESARKLIREQQFA